MRTHEKGFGVVEILIIVAIVAVIGVGGWYVWQANNKAPASTTTTPTEIQQEDEKADDNNKTFTLKYEKFSITYPDTFTLVDNSGEDEVSDPGYDSLWLTKPNGFKLTLRTGVDGIGGACEECKVIYSQAITFLGQAASVNYVDNDNSGKVASIIVTKKADDWFGVGLMGKNITSKFDGKPLPIGISIYFQDKNDALVQQDLASAKASTDVAEAVKVLESAKY